MDPYAEATYKMFTSKIITDRLKDVREMFHEHMPTNMQSSAGPLFKGVRGVNLN